MVLCISPAPSQTSFNKWINFFNSSETFKRGGEKFSRSTNCPRDFPFPSTFSLLFIRGYDRDLPLETTATSVEINFTTLVLK